jgi:hypothetical protein
LDRSLGIGRTYQERKTKGSRFVAVWGSSSICHAEDDGTYGERLRKLSHRVLKRPRKTDVRQSALQNDLSDDSLMEMFYNDIYKIRGLRSAYLTLFKDVVTRAGSVRLLEPHMSDCLAMGDLLWQFGEDPFMTRSVLEPCTMIVRLIDDTKTARAVDFREE